MSISNKQQIKDSIIDLNYKINMLQRKLNNTKASQMLYNKMIVARAVLRKKLEAFENTVFASFFDKFKFIKKSRNEKLICDYFKQ